MDYTRERLAQMTEEALDELVQDLQSEKGKSGRIAELMPVDHG
jgi:hypothetical protein